MLIKFFFRKIHQHVEHRVSLIKPNMKYVLIVHSFDTPSVQYSSFVCCLRSRKVSKSDQCISINRCFTKCVCVCCLVLHMQSCSISAEATLGFHIRWASHAAKAGGLRIQWAAHAAKCALQH